MITISILLALVIGYARKGSIKNMGNHKIKHIYLTIFSLVLEWILFYLMTSYTLTQGIVFGFIILQYGFIFLFIFNNRHEYPILIAAAGIFLNFLVIATNSGAMPLSNKVLDLGGNSTKLELLLTGKILTYKIATPSTPLWFLGDMVYIPFPLKQFLSIGDIILFIGVMLCIQKLMLSSD